MMKTPLIQQRTGRQRVVVDLKELLGLSQRAKFLSLSAMRRTNPQAGQQMSRLLARGMEFAESRRYQTGDDIRNIDWRVTARTGKAHTKLFMAEKERKVLLLADMQTPMFFATRGVFKSVQAATLASYIAWSATLAADRLGGLIVDDYTIFESRPALGKKGIFPFLHDLSAKANFFEKKEKSELPSKEIMMDRAVAHLHQISKPGSLIFIVSDFRQVTADAKKLLIQMSMHSDLCLCFIFDPMEKELPKDGLLPLRNGQNELQINTYVKANLEKYRQRFIDRRAMVASLTSYGHIHFIECSTEDDPFEVLMKHFSKR